jgi:hypothetical protein
VRRHDLDVVSLVFGLFFVGLAALTGFTNQHLGRLGGWGLPALLIGVGVVGLLASLPRQRFGRPADKTDGSFGPEAD